MSAVAIVDTDELAPGNLVELHVIRGERTRGVVAFLDAGWVHWTDETGRDHASRPNALRLLRTELPLALRVVLDDMRHDAKPNTHGSVRAHGSSEAVSNNG